MIHISKMTGKLEGFQSISTNTTTNKYCQKQNKKMTLTIFVHIVIHGQC